MSKRTRDIVILIVLAIVLIAVLILVNSSATDMTAGLRNVTNR